MQDDLQFPLSFKWEKRKDLPYELTCNQSIVINGKVYVSDPVGDLFEYTRETDQWEDLPTPTVQYGFVSLNGKLALVSGIKGGIDKYSRTIYVWDGEIQQWTEPYPPLPAAQQWPGCACYQHYLIVAGGMMETKVNSCKSVDVLDTKSGQWYKAPLMPYTGREIRSVVVGQTLYLLNRFQGIATASKAIVRVSLPTLITHAIQGKNQDSSIWEKLPDVPHYDSTLFSIGRMLLVAGGSSGGTAKTLFKGSKGVADIHLFNPHINVWMKIAELPEARFSPACIMLPSGELLVAGGGCEAKLTGATFLSSVYTATISGYY